MAKSHADADTTLYMNDDYSRCGACGRDADPDELTHLNNRLARPPGCGARFVAVSSDMDMTPRLRAAIVRTRPDLRFADDPIH
jgi:hypothetical protein